MRLLAVTLYMLGILAPHGDADVTTRIELAAAIVESGATEHEQLLLARIARFESAYRRDVADCVVRGPQGELSAWQILPRSPAERARLCRSYAEDARVALERVRESIRICAKYPPPFRLGIFVRGRCDTAEAQRLSKHRWVDPPKETE